MDEHDTEGGDVALALLFLELVEELAREVVLAAGAVAVAEGAEEEPTAAGDLGRAAKVRDGLVVLAEL